MHFQWFIQVKNKLTTSAANRRKTKTHVDRRICMRMIYGNGHRATANWVANCILKCAHQFYFPFIYYIFWVQGFEEIGRTRIRRMHWHMFLFNVHSESSPVSQSSWLQLFFSFVFVLRSILHEAKSPDDDECMEREYALNRIPKQRTSNEHVINECRVLCQEVDEHEFD